MTKLALAVMSGMFAVAISAHAQTFIPLYQFIDDGANGAYPNAGVIRDAAGNLYGTTIYGGASSAGVVFKLDADLNETVLHSFGGVADGYHPTAPLIRDAAGNLYGTTSSGGAFGFGTIFKLDRTGKETVLYSFAGGTDGAYPAAGLVRDSAGNLYGTTPQGGHGNGTIFKLDLTGKETVLYRFRGGTDGSSPSGGVIRDSAGNLYGATSAGGHLNGTIFKLDTKNNETVLYRFRGGVDGSIPTGGLVRDSGGNLYGATNYGGDLNCGCGTVFKLDSARTKTVLHNFGDYEVGDGAFPQAGVVRDAAGNLYGTTNRGGEVDAGTIFKVDSSGNESVIYSFDNTFTDGGYPIASLFLDPGGNLYGTAPIDGNNYEPFGTVYELIP